MTDYRWHFTLIVPAAYKDSWNAMAAGLGFEHGPQETWNTFCIKLSADGNDPVTHYAARFPSTSSLKTILEDAKMGTYPDVEGVTEAEMAALMGVLVDDVSETDNFHSFVASQGLSLWQAPAP